MTREEAREMLGDVRAYLASRASLENEMLAGHTFTDICNAIKALEQEPCEDAISRQAAKRALEDRFIELQKRHSEDRYETNFCLNTILELPPVTPQQKYEDIVKAFQIGMAFGFCEKNGEELIDRLKTITPRPKMGRWIPVSKKLPKKNGWHQCTVVVNDLPRTMELFYENGKWLDNRRIDMFNTFDIYGYGSTKEKHKLSYQELISEFDWTENVIAWKLLSDPYNAESEEV